MGRAIMQQGLDRYGPTLSRFRGLVFFGSSLRLELGGSFFGGFADARVPKTGGSLGPGFFDFPFKVPLAGRVRVGFWRALKAGTSSALLGGLEPGGLVVFNGWCPICPRPKQGCKSPNQSKPIQTNPNHQPGSPDHLGLSHEEKSNDWHPQAYCLICGFKAATPRSNVESPLHSN